EADDLARYLCQFTAKDIAAGLPPPPAKADVLAAFQRVEPRAEEQAAFQKLPADAQLLDLGKRLVIDRGCNNCHPIAPGGKPFANVLANTSFDDIKKPERHERGCLTPASTSGERKPPPEIAPSFTLSENERKALLLFLTEGTKGAGSPAPPHAARVM